ncbi:MAG: glycosyltransferase [Candidatus Omnitrophota bacterium]|nr:glycosyltransferase [Candidatus Omnitrophota bacterium]
MKTSPSSLLSEIEEAARWARDVQSGVDRDHAGKRDAVEVKVTEKVKSALSGFEIDKDNVSKSLRSFVINNFFEMYKAAGIRNIDKFRSIFTRAVKDCISVRLASVSGLHTIIEKACDEAEREVLNKTTARSIPVGLIPKNISFVELHFTNKCNQNCEWCSYGDADKKKHLKFKDLDKVAELAPSEILIVGGGEPTLYEDGGKTFNDAIGRLRELLPTVRLRLITNGVVIPPGDWQYKIDEISVSFDESTRESYLANKKIDGFDSVWRNVTTGYMVEGPIRSVRVSMVYNAEKIDSGFLLAEKLWKKWSDLIDRHEIPEEKAKNFRFMMFPKADDSIPDKPYEDSILTDAQKGKWQEKLDIIRTENPAFFAFLKEHTNLCTQHMRDLYVPPSGKCWSVSNYVLIGADRMLYPCFVACGACRGINLGSLDQASADILDRRIALFSDPPMRCHQGCRPNTTFYGLRSFEMLFERITAELRDAEEAIKPLRGDDYAKAFDYYSERVNIAISMFRQKIAQSQDEAEKAQYLNEIRRLSLNLDRFKPVEELKGYIGSIRPELLSLINSMFSNHRYGTFGGNFSFTPSPSGEQDPIRSVSDIEERYGDTNVYWPVLSADEKKDVFERLSVVMKLGAAQYIESSVKDYVKRFYGVDCEIVAIYTNGSYLYGQSKTVPPGDLDNVTFIRVNKPGLAIRDMAYEIAEDKKDPRLNISGMAIQTVDDIGDDHPHTQTALISIFRGGIPILERERLSGKFDRKNMLFGAFSLLEDSRMTFSLPDLRKRASCFNRLAETKAILYKLGLTEKFDYDAEWEKEDIFMKAASSGDADILNSLTDDITRSYIELRTIIERALEEEMTELLREIVAEYSAADTDAGRQLVIQGYTEKLRKANGPEYGFPQNEHVFRAWTSRVRLAMDTQALEREHLALLSINDPAIDRRLARNSPFLSVDKALKNKGFTNTGRAPAGRRESKKEDALPELIDRICGSGSVLSKQQALYALGEMESGRAVPFILGFCQSLLSSRVAPDSVEESVLNVAIEAMAKCGTDKAVSFIFDVFENGGLGVSYATAKNSRVAMDALIKLSGNPGIKIIVAWRIDELARKLAQKQDSRDASAESDDNYRSERIAALSAALSPSQMRTGNNLFEKVNLPKLMINVSFQDPDHLAGGQGWAVLNLCKAQIEQGFDVVWISPCIRDEQPGEFNYFNGKLKVIKMRISDSPILTLYSNDEETQDHRKIFGDKFVKYIKENYGAGDITVHLHGFIEVPRRAAELRAFGYNVISTFHMFLSPRIVATHANEKFLKKLKELEYEAIMGNSKIIVNSAGMVDEVMDLCPDYKGSIYLVRNGVSDEYFNVPNMRREGAPLTVTTYGRISPEKGFDIFIEAAKIVTERRKKSGKEEVKFLVFGNNDDSIKARREYLEDLRRRREGFDNISVIARPEGIQGDEKWSYLDSSTIGVVPSLYEPFGLVIPEFMARGLPVITTLIPGAIDILKSDKLGPTPFGIIADKTPESMADAMEWMLDHPAETRKMGKNAGERSKNYRWSEVLKETIDVYKTKTDVLPIEKEEAGYDASGATMLLTDLLYTQLHNDRNYEIKYDASKLTSSQIEIIEEYVKLLRARSPYPGGIKLKPFSSTQGSGESLIAVYCTGKDFKGEGHVDVSIPEGELKDYLLRITGMINIALASANIPDNLSQEDVEKYRPMLSYIKNQYKVILGGELSIPDSPADILKVIRRIVVGLPRSMRMNTGQIEEFNRLAKEALVAA